MTLAPPPAARPPGAPVIDVLAAGTSLFRVHDDHPADAFTPTPQPSRRSGGRFDSLDGSYGCTYLGQTPGAALAEAVCRDLPLDGSAREVPRARIAGRRLSEVTVTRDLCVLVLHGPALSHVGAALDLTKSEAGQHVTTRRWARSFLSWLPEIAGIRYRPRHDEDSFACVLVHEGPAAPGGRARGALRARAGCGLDLVSPDGQALLRQVLHHHNAVLSIPPA